VPPSANGLTVEGLSVGYRNIDGQSTTQVVKGVDLELRPGCVRGLVGESGCGKSTLALSALGYRKGGSVILEGRSLLGERDLLQLGRRELQRVWGREVAYLAQNAAAALDPALTIRRHFQDVLKRHLNLTKDGAAENAREMLTAVGLPDPLRALERYPHEFSGGQQQRISLALAVSCRPGVLILDEPTTGLDVTTRAQISSLLTDLVAELGIAALYVSHDIALLAKLASELSVMYCGEIVESGLTEELVDEAKHPYTRALLGSIPSVRGARVVSGIPGEPPPEVVPTACAFAPRCRYSVDACTRESPRVHRLSPTHTARCERLEIVQRDRAASVDSAQQAAAKGAALTHDLLRVNDLSCYYGRRDRRLIAVRNVTFAISSSEALGIVGLSGSGKSTLLRAIAGLHGLVDGEIAFRDTPLTRDARRRPRSIRREIQIVFQDPGSSLNPRHRVGSLIQRPLRLCRPDLARTERMDRVVELMEQVRLPTRLIDRYPSELSGGQQQRVAIARAFSTAPALLLCDEITSSLDVSVQAAIIELVRDLADASGTAVIFVSHDLAVVRCVADRTIVMLHGEVCEEAPTEQLFDHPSHAYTRELLAAIPDLVDVRAARDDAPVVSS
jgi:peptide/nickel transport system ATP-binding protein